MAEMMQDGQATGERLRDYQWDIVARVLEAWRSYRSVMVQMPTGTGKTHVLAAIVRSSLTPAPSPRERGVDSISGCDDGNGGNYGGNYSSNYVCNKETAEKHITPLSFGEGAGVRLPGGLYGPVWIIAHRRELVAQIEETIQKMYAGFAENSSSFILHSSFPKSSSLIKVFSIQWLSRHWEDVEGKPSLIVIDEAHHALADTYRELWRRYPGARKLGMTATPCRMNRRGFTDLFDVLLTSWSVAEFIRKGRLSPFDYVSIKPGSEEQRLIDSLEKRGADGDYQLREMNAVLNRRPSIERLYQSVVRYARGKKGIVYAISIEHARSIAEYYNRKGISTAVIDSKTPAEERRRIVEEFRSLSGVRLLVNVDVFSEGFDCPDVEFIQLARPTLSLAKYLQQVGRGLRRSEGKEACVIIDNVGLYRVFGLPTVAWDWEAMFRGRMAGKGSTANRKQQEDVPCTENKSMAAVRNGDGILNADTKQNTDNMEVVMSHASLLEAIENNAACDMPSLQTAQKRELKAWQDDVSGLWGLKRGCEQLTEAQYVTVFDIRYDMAAVRFKDMNCGIVNDTGEAVWKESRCKSMKFRGNHFLSITETDGMDHYLDLYSLRRYDMKPTVKRFGGIELLKSGPVYYSRTKTIYVNNQDIDDSYIYHRGFYVVICDFKTPATGSQEEGSPYGYRCGYACLLEGDHESFYYIYRWLADGSIVIRDKEGRYYHAMEGRGKEYIGCGDPADAGSVCHREIERLTAAATAATRNREKEKEEKKKQTRDAGGTAVPFCSGMKWGLKAGGQILVPPIYRNVRPPVGRYCVVEKNYSQWGIIALDGTILVEPRYQEVAVEENGNAVLTSVTGRKVSMKLR